MIVKPVYIDNVDMFPIGPIFNMTDKGSETVSRNSSAVYSQVTFEGACYKVTEGKTTVEEYVLVESGNCSELSGQSYKLEKSAIFPYSDEGAFVPLSFLEEIILNKDIDFDGENMTIARFDNKRVESYVFGTQDDVQKSRRSMFSL